MVERGPRGIWNRVRSFQNIADSAYDRISNRVSGFFYDLRTALSNHTDLENLCREYQTQIKTLKGDAVQKKEEIGALCSCILSQEQDLKLNQVEIESLNETLASYVGNVHETPEYKVVQERVADLENLVGQQKKVMRGMEKALKLAPIHQAQAREYSLITAAETVDSELSYIIVKDLDRVLVVTKGLAKALKLPERAVRGAKYTDILHSPENIPAAEFQRMVTELLMRPDEIIEREIAIRDGTGKPKFVSIHKHKAEVIKMFRVERGEVVENPVAFYTRVDVHELGIVAKMGDGIYRTVYHKDRPKTVQGQIEVEIIKRKKEEERTFKQDVKPIIPVLIARGMSSDKILEIWDATKDFEKFKQVCEKSLNERI